MSELKATWYDEPRTMYLRQKKEYGGYGYVAKYEVIGETSRSWLTRHRWNPGKQQKHQVEIVDEVAYQESRWAADNRYRISQIVGGYWIAPEKLRKIAEIIGYKERK